MDEQQVLERLQLLTEDDRSGLLSVLCADAVRMLSGRLRCTAEEAEANAPALCAAAAAYAAYLLTLLDEALSPDSMTAGEVRAEFKNGSARALAYYRTCEAAVAPLLRDEGFYFGGVRAWEE